MASQCQHCGASGQAAVCNTKISSEHWLESRLLHVRSSSLLMHMDEQQNTAQMTEPLYPDGRPGGIAWLLASDRR